MFSIYLQALAVFVPLLLVMTLLILILAIIVAVFTGFDSKPLLQSLRMIIGMIVSIFGR